jgi:hypothetical protein
MVTYTCTSNKGEAAVRIVYRSEGIRLRGKRHQHFGKGNTPWDCINHLGDDGLAGVLEEGTVVGKSIELR